jgi:hypothetical protein
MIPTRFRWSSRDWNNRLSPASARMLTPRGGTGVDAEAGAALPLISRLPTLCGGGAMRRHGASMGGCRRPCRLRLEPGNEPGARRAGPGSLSQMFK